MYGAGFLPERVAELSTSEFSYKDCGQWQNTPMSCSETSDHEHYKLQARRQRKPNANLCQALLQSVTQWLASLACSPSEEEHFNVSTPPFAELCCAFQLSSYNMVSPQ